MGHRAEALADRLLEGANALADFAELLTDAEWRAPMSPDAYDQRPVGVLVNHVASVYPIEVDVARATASGKGVDVTWAAIAEMNAKHTADHNSTKEATIALLRANSQAAADAIRTFTDEQLDTAAPFGLAYGAPVTAQFVIEDHAMRHSYHHLAKIRAGLGR